MILKVLQRFFSNSSFAGHLILWYPLLSDCLWIANWLGHTWLRALDTSSNLPEATTRLYVVSNPSFFGILPPLIIQRKKEKASTLTLHTQVFHVHLALILRGLFQLKYEMLKIMEPYKEFQHNLEIIIYSNIWEKFKWWLLENFKTNDKKYRKVLDTIEELIKQYEKCISHIV